MWNSARDRMTPERLAFIINHCYRRRGRDSLIAYRGDVARFLGITPRTLRRYLTGAQPIPRQIEVILEILHHYPAITAQAVDFLIQHVNDGDLDPDNQ
jgi:hypothetical protein